MKKPQAVEPQPTQLTQFAIDQAERLAARQRMAQLDAEEKAQRDAQIAKAHATTLPTNPNSPFNTDGTRRAVQVKPSIVLPPPTKQELAETVKAKLNPPIYDPLTASLPPALREVYGIPTAAVEAKKSITLKPQPATVRPAMGARGEVPLTGAELREAGLRKRPAAAVPSYLLKACPVCHEPIEASRGFHTRANGGTCVVDAQSALRDGVVAGG